jgi:signal transduction histidine kinase
VRRRLLLVVVATTTLVVIAFAVPLGGLVRSVARDRAVTAAERDAAALAPVLAVTDDHDLLSSAVARTATGSEGRLSVVLPDGTRLGADTTPMDGAALALANRRQAAFSQSAADGLVLYSPVVTGQGRVSVIRARVPSALLDHGVANAWAALAAVAFALVVAAAVIADRLARSLTRDAAAVAATAHTLAGGDSQARVTPGSTPELAEAARALNLLADRIDELRTVERERVADLSHRLRTPLTGLRLDAEASGNAAVVAGVDRLEAAVSELVRAARRPLHASPVAAACDLAAVVRERAQFWSALADDDGRSWTITIPEHLVAHARIGADEAAAAIDALVGNVFAHTDEGTPYAIDVTADALTVSLTVEDGGPGIPSPEAVLERGVTGGGSTGLGLDIARQAAEAASGSLSISRSRLGGAAVTLRLPR